VGVRQHPGGAALAPPLSGGLLDGPRFCPRVLGALILQVSGPFPSFAMRGMN
jgi:hypothetical protein